MKPHGKGILVLVNKQEKDVTNLSGINLFRMHDYNNNKRESNVDCGIVVETSNVATDIQKGDKVYFHFLALTEDRFKVDTDTHWVQYSDCYFLEREGELKAIGGYIVCEPVLEDNIKTASGIYIKSVEERVKNTAKVIAVGKDCSEVQVGDTIVHIPQANYEMEFNRKPVFRMQEDEVLYIINK